MYLADDSAVPLAVESLASLTAHELHRAVREVLQLPDIALEAFALWLVSPLLGEAGGGGHTGHRGSRQGGPVGGWGLSSPFSATGTPSSESPIPTCGCLRRATKSVLLPEWVQGGGKVWGGARLASRTVSAGGGREEA